MRDGQPQRYSALASRDGVPRVHPSAQLRDCELGRFTEVKERVQLAECVIGDYSYIERHTQAIYCTIGKFTSIAANACLGALEHPLERVSQHKITYRPNEYFLNAKVDGAFRQRRQNRRVTIGHDVWVGHGAIIKAGVHIGNGAVIGAGAVVTEDVAPYAIVVGSPAKFLRPRFEAPIAHALNHLSWWDWDHDRLAGVITDMQTLSPEDFIARYRA